MHSLSLLTVFVATQLLTALADDTCQPGYTTTNVAGLTCTSECNTDHAGGDYGATYTGTYSGCVQACTSDANCQTAQFNQGNGYCYLKNAINPGSPSGNTDSITCQQPSSGGSTTTTTTTTTTPASTPTPTPITSDCSTDPTTKVFPSGRKCTTSCSSDRAGGDYSSTYTGSFQGCIDACGSDPQCITAQYHDDNGYCYLKNYSNNLNPSTTTDTVDCSNPPLFYIQATQISLKYNGNLQGVGTKDQGLYNSNGQYGSLVPYGSDYLITYQSPDTTTAEAFYIDGAGALRSNSTGYFGVTSTGYVAGKFYITNPNADPSYLNGYSAPTCSIGDGNVLSCVNGNQNTFSVCFSGKQSVTYPKGQNGDMYFAQVPHNPDQGNQCRYLVAVVSYA